MATISYCGGSEFIHQKPAQSILPGTYANARVNSPLQSVIGHNKAAPHRNSTQPMHHGDMQYTAMSLWNFMQSVSGSWSSESSSYFSTIYPAMVELLQELRPRTCRVDCENRPVTGHHAAGRVHATLATHRVAESQVDAVTEVLTAEGLLGIVDGDPDALHGLAAIRLANTVVGTQEQFVLGFARRAAPTRNLPRVSCKTSAPPRNAARRAEGRAYPHVRLNLPSVQPADVVAGFPPCAKPDALAEIDEPVRLAECESQP